MSIIRNQSSGIRAKRAFDLAVVLLASPFWLPLIVALSVLVRLKLGAPVFFRQKRAGLHARIFEIIKFRTMTDARGASGQLLPDAVRLTPFGLWLRSTSLDELPEILNVLRGDMSLVGPRPLLVQYLDRYTQRQSRRHEVPPGITGLVQVKGRNSLSWDEKFELDLRYVETRSFWLDLEILFLTVKTVLVRQGISAQGDATMPEFNPKATGPSSNSTRRST